jgi:hypothetical protein
VTLYLWIALGVSAVVVAASVAFASARALQAWRTYRHFQRRTFDGLDDIGRRTTRIERRLDALGENTARLQAAQTELNESLASARVLSSALADVRATVSRLTGIVPSK